MALRAVVFAFSFWLGSALAQIGGSGSIQGVISDPGGGVIPNATVTATNTVTGVQTARATTSAGYYNLSPLPPGDYSIAVTASGFDRLVQEHIVVDALAVVGLNLQLRVGGTSQEVTVTAAPPPVDTTDASMGQTVRNEVYTALPLAMSGSAPRDPTAFTQYMPGVTSQTGNTAGNIYGAQANSQDVYVQGLPVTNAVLEGESRDVALGVSVEAVDQFQVETAGTAPMYQGQGSTNFVIKSGTNQFHGAAYEYFRNTDLDARGFFAAATPVEHTNEFGGSIGGPIRKNRVFFFGNYDGYRVVQGGQPAYYSLPTAAERQGNFSALTVAIYDPLSTNCAGGVWSRTPFPGNTIPANRLSKASQFFLQPMPATTNAGFQNNFLNAVPVGYYTNNTTDKVDFNLSDKNRFYVDFSHGERGQSTPYRGQTLPLPYAERARFTKFRPPRRQAILMSSRPDC